MDNQSGSNFAPRKRYTFVQPQDPNDLTGFREEDTIHFFYQLATYPNPKRSKKFHMRKFIINGKNEFQDVQEYYLTRNQYDRFIKSKKCHEFKAYSVYDLENVSYPTMADIQTAKSDIICNEYDYTGFAPFRN